MKRYRMRTHTIKQLLKQLNSLYLTHWKTPKHAALYILLGALVYIFSKQSIHLGIIVAISLLIPYLYSVGEVLWDKYVDSKVNEYEKNSGDKDVVYELKTAEGFKIAEVDELTYRKSVLEADINFKDKVLQSFNILGLFFDLLAWLN